MRALDLFAGTGWGVACKQLGIEEDGAEIMPEVVATREMHGMRTPFGDVAALPDDVAVLYNLLLASPPCQTFSQAGKGSGRQAFDKVLAAIDVIARGEPHDRSEGDPRTWLVLDPLRISLGSLPVYIAWEQVPSVLPVWEACARVLEGVGYSTWTGTLHSEQYGVPQTRKRAVLMARLDGPVAPPVPTHSRYYSRTPDRLDPGLFRWVSMAEALGWGMTERPSMTVTGQPAEGDGRWRHRDDWMTDPERAKLERLDDGRLRVADQSGTPVDLSWPENRPATVLAGRDLVQHPGATANRYNGSTKSRNDGIRVTVEEAAVLQSYPPGFTFAGKTGRQYLQVGNAVPPLMAEAIILALIVP